MPVVKKHAGQRRELLPWMQFSKHADVLQDFAGEGRLGWKITWCERVYFAANLA